VDPEQLDFEDTNAQRQGICGDVFLKSHGDLRVTDDTFVITSVERKNISCRANVRNEERLPANFSLSCEVLDADGKVVGKFPGKGGTLQPGASGVFEASSSWDDPRLWSPDDPYLYRLRTTLTERLRQSGRRTDDPLRFQGNRLEGPETLPERPGTSPAWNG